MEGPKALTPALPRAGSATHSDNAALSCELGLDHGSPQCVLQSNVPWAVTGYQVTKESSGQTSLGKLVVLFLFFVVFVVVVFWVFFFFFGKLVLS